MAIGLYSSGPFDTRGTGASQGTVNVKNLTNDTVEVRVRVFRLNGTRFLEREVRFSVGSFGSNFRVFVGSNSYSITVRLETPANVDNVLISYLARDGSGNFIPFQRLVHEEFHRLQ